MKWCIGKELDGVVTDDPKRFLEVCDNWEGGERGIEIDAKVWAAISWTNFVILLFSMVIWWRLGRVGREGRVAREHYLRRQGGGIAALPGLQSR